MIKLVFCLKRKEGLSREEFLDHWINRHAPLVRGFAGPLGIRRYVQNYRVDDERLNPVIFARDSLRAMSEVDVAVRSILPLQP